VNIVTKSGTNAIHGDGFEFLRNGSLNARNFFAPTQDTLKRNQFGGSVGGPIKKDKLFYFGTYQGTRTRSAAQGVIAQVPTAAERSGDFSDLCPAGFDATGNCISTPQNPGEQIHNPDTNQPFPHNFIDPTRFSPAAVYFLNLIPKPNGPEHQLTFAGPSIRENEDQWMTKIDYARSRHQNKRAVLLDEFQTPAFRCQGQYPRGRRQRQPGARSEHRDQPHLHRITQPASEHVVRLGSAERRLTVRCAL